MMNIMMIKENFMMKTEINMKANSPKGKKMENFLCMIKMEN